MIGLLQAEFIKVGKRKLVYILAAVLALLTFLNALFQLVLASFIEGGDVLTIPVDRPDVFFLAFSDVAGQSLLAVIIGAAIFAAEFANGTWAASLTRDAVRWRQLLARFFVYVDAAVLMAVVGLIVWFAAIFAWADGSGTPAIGELGLAFLRLVLAMMLWVAIGMAAASIARSGGLAVGLAVGVSFVEGILSIWGGYQPYSMSTAVAGLFLESGNIITGPIEFFVPTPTRAVITILLWMAFWLGLTWVMSARRDA